MAASADPQRQTIAPGDVLDSPAFDLHIVVLDTSRDLLRAEVQGAVVATEGRFIGTRARRSDFSCATVHFACAKACAERESWRLGPR
jgi:hypothetical protein